MRLGLDSTDSRQGGCTTHVAAHILARLDEYAVLDAPRLVRLNPNIPYKTRGNGALCIQLGHPVGPTSTVGVVGGREIRAANQVEPLSPREQRKAFEQAAEVVDDLRSADSNAALLAFAIPPSVSHYWDAVQRHVDAAQPTPMIHERTWGDGRGRIGATAAAAWPASRGTWEAIAYREPHRIGTPRGLAPTLGCELDEALPRSFDNWDSHHDHLRIAPASPCPILAAVRATDRDEAIGSVAHLGPEPVDSWLLFWTNQATGDHLRTAVLGDLRPFDSVQADVRVVEDPSTLRGGHVFLPIQDATGSAVAAAYEPTKEFRDAVRGLSAGDEIQIEASAHEDVRTLALEAFTLRTAATIERIRPPNCPACGRSMKSAGRRSAYRCTPCGTRSSATAATRLRQARQPVGTRFTVPPAVRRHLSRPNGIDDSRLLPPHLALA